VKERARLIVGGMPMGMYGNQPSPKCFGWVGQKERITARRMRNR
jgi:hypothetical protein